MHRSSCNPLSACRGCRCASGSSLCSWHRSTGPQLESLGRLLEATLGGAQCIHVELLPARPQSKKSCCCRMSAAVIYYQLAVDLAGVFSQVARVTEQRAGTISDPLQLREFPIDRAAHAAMPEHGEHEMGRTNVESVEVHQSQKLPSLNSSTHWSAICSATWSRTNFGNVSLHLEVMLPCSK